MTSYEFQIPMAFDKNNILVKPFDAIKHELYYCPLCGGELIFRKGTKRIAHFSHKASDFCSYETITHKIAKLLVVYAVEDWVNKLGKNVDILRECSSCGKSFTQHLPGKVLSAAMEYKLQSGYIADVALLGDGNIPLAVVEIYVSHRVDEVKAENIDIPFMELNGYEILNNPHTWNVISEGNLYKIPHPCDALVGVVTIKANLKSSDMISRMFGGYQ